MGSSVFNNLELGKDAWIDTDISVERSLLEKLPPTKNDGQEKITVICPSALKRIMVKTDQRVKFLSRGDGYTLFLTETEAVLRLQGFLRYK